MADDDDEPDACGGELELPLQPADNTTSATTAPTPAAVLGAIHMRALSFPDRNRIRTNFGVLNT
ncbi:hypothetical protein ACQ856_17780 [Mycolicibacterium psychrotolerans]|uniref:hypothetical protein n=1 Tax=Mycolicibacterium psychrotolerans TaxID=216929 RepID=UPI003D678106